jgi:hypothetical protein
MQILESHILAVKEKLMCYLSVLLKNNLRTSSEFFSAHKPQLMIISLSRKKFTGLCDCLRINDTSLFSSNVSFAFQTIRVYNLEANLDFPKSTFREAV